jgi:hypothetical protein
LQIDEAKVVEKFVCVMVSIRVENNVFAVAWHSEQTGGHINFEAQKKLLNRVYDLLPKNVPVILHGNRFYGTKLLVAWCQEHKISYRIRIKCNALFQHENAIISMQEAFDMGMKSMSNATFGNSTITTNIAILQDKEHSKPWFIAMDCNPDKKDVLDYGMCWDIKALILDLKSHRLLHTPMNSYRFGV